MSAVDLSKARKGDTVHFRCGGSAVLLSFRTGGGEYACIEFQDYQDGAWSYKINGLWGCSNSDYPFDIIAIEPAPFDWSTVKPGMAFKHALTDKAIHHFIGKSLWRDTCVVTAKKSEGVACPECSHQDTAFLTRAPEHDIEVQS
jgi:hypothetical protein